MNKNDKTSASADTRLSKFLSLVLRHDPQRIGLSLDATGWADVDDLITRARAVGVPLDRVALQRVVLGNDKQRFALDPDARRIRANQGHTVVVDLDLPDVVPPPVLFHGTASRFLDAILAAGLSRQARHHVHMTEQVDTAVAVGLRYGAAVILQIDAAAMHLDRHRFHCTANRVWLTDAVPARYLCVRP